MKNKLVTLFCMTLLLSGCMSTCRQPVPDLEMVYDIPYSHPNQLGFVNSDGSDSTILTLGSSLRSRLFRPVWSMDGNYIYGLSSSPMPIDSGYPAYWNVHKGSFKICKPQGYLFFMIEGTGNPDNMAEVLVSNAHEILQVDLATCEYKTIIEYGPDFHLYGFSYDPVGGELLYSFSEHYYYAPDYIIQKLNLKTGESVELGEGTHPVWSPDRSRIAYVRGDGIYTMGAGGENPTLLWSGDWHDDPFSPWTPTPRWSPDEKWITYFDCKKAECYRDLTIFRIPSDGGAPQEIVTGGMNASWKP